MSINLRKTSRNFHLWLSLAIFIPVVVVIGSGLLLQVKKRVRLATTAYPKSRW